MLKKEDIVERKRNRRKSRAISALWEPLKGKRILEDGALQALLRLNHPPKTKKVREDN